MHISNLIEPSLRRLVRSVDSEHVQFLTEEFKTNSTSFVILAGFVENDCDVLSLREPDCGTEVEVIGGNPSRIALQYLLASGYLTEETELNFTVDSLMMKHWKLVCSTTARPRSQRR